MSIPTKEVDRLTKFYRDCFGWKFEKMTITGLEYWLITTGPRGKSVGGGIFKKLQSHDIDAAIEGFKEAGGTIIVPKEEIPGTGWSAIGLDPEENPVGLYQSVRRPSRASERKSKGR